MATQEFFIQTSASSEASTPMKISLSLTTEQSSTPRECRPSTSQHSLPSGDSRQETISHLSILKTTEPTQTAQRHDARTQSQMALLLPLTSRAGQHTQQAH